MRSSTQTDDIPKSQATVTADEAGLTMCEKDTNSISNDDHLPLESRERYGSVCIDYVFISVSMNEKVSRAGEFGIPGQAKLL